MKCKFLGCEMNSRGVSEQCSKFNKSVNSGYDCALCADREFETQVVVKVHVGRCDKCPHVVRERTPKAGYAHDYYCGATTDNRKIVGYVEYDHEIPDVPQWCPFR